MHTSSAIKGNTLAPRKVLTPGVRIGEKPLLDHLHLIHDLRSQLAARVQLKAAGRRLVWAMSDSIQVEGTGMRSVG